VPVPSANALDRPLSRELGKRTADAFAKQLGLVTVGDLLRHYPKHLARMGQLTELGDLGVGEHVTVIAEVVRTTSRPFKARPGYLIETVITDGRDQLRLAFFAKHKGSAAWRAGQLKPGNRMMFAGKVDSYGGDLQLAMPDYRPLDDDFGEAEARVRIDTPTPIYPGTTKVSSWTIESSVRMVLSTLTADEVPDPLPRAVQLRRRMPSLLDAFWLMHCPTDEEQWERARDRLRYEEAYVMQAALARRRAAARVVAATPRPGRDDGLLAAFDARLPFDLTAGQRAVGDTIAAELADEHPMNRLLQGEVGSGKTVVALRAMLAVVDAGGQAALLAPTEVLATQHHRSITAMLGDLAAGGMLGGAQEATRVTLLTGSQPTAVRRRAMLDAASGEAGVVVGTHALLGEDVDFFDLGLVVVDEQHRFGVEQRDLLRAKAGRPAHVLVMTATPIPRTVAMTVFGDLDISTLTELPAGRQPITTHVVPGGNEAWVERTWSRVREECAAGRQVYVVCPRIGGDAPDATATDDAGGDRRPAVAVLDVAELLRTHPAMAGLRLGVLHGRMPTDAKDTVMRAFAAGAVDVLLATTVIEVGVDVPNATAMVVLDADWFGISQLHQLRGRVGRGGHPGLCLLVSDARPGSPGRERLDAVASTLDGFELSLVDLASRREGDVLGSAQSGLTSSLRLLRVREHEDVIAEARADALPLVDVDPELHSSPALAQAISQLLDPRREAFLERG
jgi:ATP-dependent DNA helicase RecG